MLFSTNISVISCFAHLSELITLFPATPTQMSDIGTYSPPTPPPNRPATTDNLISNLFEEPVIRQTKVTNQMVHF